MALDFVLNINPKVKAQCHLIRAADKTPIYLCKALANKDYLPGIRQAIALEPELFKITDDPPPLGGYAITWGAKKRTVRNAAMETGFWKSGIHADPRGLYYASTFNTPDGLAQVRGFRAPKGAAEIVLSGDYAKYRQDVEDVEWDGVVLPLQVAGDRSIRSVGRSSAFWKFVEDACKRYKKNLLLKAHPCLGSSDRGIAQDLANVHGARYAMTNYTCITKCKFVLVYNSTFAMDAFVRGVPVVEFAPGYWYQTGAVTYTAGEYPDDHEDTVEMGHRIADFAIWRYCWNWEITAEQWLEILRTFASSAQLFPLPTHLSYAATIEQVSKQWVYRF